MFLPVRPEVVGGAPRPSRQGRLVYAPPRLFVVRADKLFGAGCGG